MLEKKTAQWQLSEEEREFQEQIDNIGSEELNKMMFSMPEQAHQMRDLDDEEDEELGDDETVYADSIDAFEGDTAFSSTLDENREMSPKNKYPTLDDDKYVSGRRRVIDYGGTPYQTKMEMQYRALEAAKANNKILNGVVIGASMKRSLNGMVDVLYLVEITDDYCRGARVNIIGEKMSKILIWNGRERDKEYTIRLRRRWAKQLIHAEIQFCIESITVFDKDSVRPEYFISGNRIMANQLLSDYYFNPNDPEGLREGDIINGKVLAVFSNRVVFSIAGHDLYLYSTIPYITGTSRIVPDTSAKQFFEQNQYMEALINNIRRAETNESVISLRVSFYEPVREEVMRIIDGMDIDGYYSGTVLRYLPPKDDGTTSYMIVKADIGVEVLCFLPNWKRPPMPMDSVKLKIVNIRPNGENTLVIGSLKR